MMNHTEAKILFRNAKAEKFLVCSESEEKYISENYEGVESFHNLPEVSKASSQAKILAVNLAQPFRKYEENMNWYNKLVTKAPYIDGLENPLAPIEDIDWLELPRIKRALNFFNDYYSLFLLSGALGMALVTLSVKRISTVVFQTDKPIDKKLQFRRFLGKLRGTKKMFRVLLDPENARRHFYKIRKLHAMVQQRIPNIGKGTPIPDLIIWKEEPWMDILAQAVKEDLKQIETTPEKMNKCLPLLTWEGSVKCPVSQFDMVHLVAAFFGPVWLSPHLHGMKMGKNDEKMKDFIHVWAVMARLLGLRDEFNVYINPEPEIIDRIVKDVYVTSMKNMDSCISYLGGITISGIQEHFPLITHKSGLLLTLVALGCEWKGNLRNIMEFRDKMYFLILMGIAWILGHFKVIRMGANKIFKVWLDRIYSKCLVDARTRG